MSANSSYINPLLASLAFWFVWSGLHILVLLQFQLGWSLSVADSLVSNVALALGCYLIVTTLKWYQPGKANAVILVVWIAVLAKLCVLGTIYALRYLFGSEVFYVEVLEKSQLIRFAVVFLGISMVALGRWVYNTQQLAKEDARRQADAEKLVRDAELTGLRQQLQPHFLFNSLNSISALVGSKPAAARTMIQQLSDFLRGTLRKDEQKLVSLEEELRHLNLYLDIEKVRFGHRLVTKIDAEAESLSLELPPLLLQPLVENAIKFGLYDTVGEIEIAIRTRATTGYLEIVITNPFDPETSRPRQGTGFGLSSVQRRLFLMYSRNDLLQANASGRIFTTSVRIPQTK